MTSKNEIEYLQELAAAPVDEQTKASIEEAQAQYARGEFVTWEQSNINLEKFISEYANNSPRVRARKS